MVVVVVAVVAVVDAVMTKRVNGKLATKGYWMYWILILILDC